MCSSDLADYPAGVLGLGATVVTTRRRIAADDFFTGLFSTALEDGEIVLKVEFPLPKRAAYMKFAHPASGFSLTGSFVAETAGGMRVAVNGAGPCVFRWKDAETALGKALTPAAVDALTLASDELNSDMHGDAAYRANLAKVMTRRAVQQMLGA